MAKHPVMIEYSYELKENLARRAIALIIDLIVVGIPLFILFVFLGLGLLQANPMNAIFGLLGPFFYNQQVQGVDETSPFISMIVFVILQSFMLPIYYAVRESDSKRTVGKYLMHLDPIRSDNMFPTKWDALQRNYLKFFIGAIGGYLLGFIGWFLFIGIACLIDLKIAPEYKLDVRQRATEIPFGTVVLVERPKAPLGRISIDSGKWAKMKDKEKKAHKFAIRMKRENRAKSKLVKVHGKYEDKRRKIKTSLEKTSRKTHNILDEDTKKGALFSTSTEKVKVKKEKTLLNRPEPEDDLDIELDAEEETKKISEPLLPKKKETKAVKIFKKAPPLEEGEEDQPEKEEKVSFFKKFFGFGHKEKKEDEEVDEGLSATLGSELPPTKKDSSKDETTLQFMFDFDIDESRAMGLYEMGYRKKEDLKDAIPEDLMMIKGINPTIAKRILKTANE